MNYVNLIGANIRLKEATIASTVDLGISFLCKDEYFILRHVKWTYNPDSVTFLVTRMLTSADYWLDVSHFNLESSIRKSQKHRLTNIFQ